jgi:hypothetical protein
MPRIRAPIGTDGPVIDVGIWIPRAMAHELVARKRAVPPPQFIRALIDTGADRTAIHPAASGALTAPPAGIILVRRAGSATNGRRVNSTTYVSRSVAPSIRQ